MTMTVSDAMTRGPVTMRHDAKVREAARRMKKSGIGDVIVTRGDEACGILTDRDIVLRCIAVGGDPNEMRIGDICSSNLLTVHSTETLLNAETIMRRRAVRRLIVEEHGAPLGILTLADVERRLHPESAIADIAEAPPSA